MSLDATQSEPASAPTLRRRIGAPGRLLLALLVLLPLPLGAALGYLDPGALTVSARIFLIFVVLMAAFRVLGKRELGRLSPFELVTLMLIPEVLSNAVQGEGSVLESLTGLSTLFLLVLLTSVLAHRFEVFEKLVEARPTVLVARGKLVEDALNRERIVPDELQSEMHKQGFRELSEVRWGILEGSGNITFVPERADPPTPRSEGQADKV
jgi:uncharacterized membrane protein YcaP (DUF421 family)